ncbi:MAG TPA: ubiquinone biosynthesis protein UbiB, partial [Oceanicaulis sp.]|nr:ubiquinone biosynthesis protein UbiB [Oceanicaulis sp.]
PAVERFMRRELGPQGRIEDLMESFDRAKTILKRLPDTLDELTETAKVLRERDTRQSANPTWLIAALSVVAGASTAIAVLLAVM